MVSCDRHAAARLEWCPDDDFMEIPPLFEPPVAGNDEKQLLEELSLLCILDSAERLEGLKREQAHFLKFRNWLQREVKRAKAGTYPVVGDSTRYVNLSRSARQQMIKDKFEILSANLSIGLVARGIMRIRDNAENLFTGNCDTLALLMEDDVLTEIYNAVGFGFSDVLRMLSNTKPNPRILEVGAGTGGTTEFILRDLVGSGGNPSYSVYTFTDISAGFFRKQWKDSLRNLQLLLQSYGHLVLSEVCAVARAPGYVFGNISGWWLGEADGRVYEPYVSVDRWNSELKAAGFTGADTAVYDAEEPYQSYAAIATQPRLEGSKSHNRVVSVLCGRPEEGISQHLIKKLRRADLRVSTVRFGETLPLDQDIISTLDLESFFFENITEQRFWPSKNFCVIINRKSYSG
ncbi:hypothetical protein MMC15_002307 [Xylographa vitiligo]|nr:hypothetical protein [Xylographa vitiligo]